MFTDGFFMNLLLSGYGAISVHEGRTLENVSGKMSAVVASSWQRHVLSEWVSH